MPEPRPNPTGPQPPRVRTRALPDPPAVTRNGQHQAEPEAETPAEFMQRAAVVDEAQRAADRERVLAGAPHADPAIVEEGLRTCSGLEHDPWALLRYVTDALNGGVIGFGDLARFQDGYVEAVGKRKPDEWNALLDAGRRLFKYEKKQIRAALARHTGEVRQTAFLATDETLVEVIRDPAAPLAEQIKYLVYDRATRTTQTALDLTVHQVQHVPPRDAFTMTKGKPTCHLADGVEPYGTDAAHHAALVAFIQSIIYHPHPAFGLVCASYVRLTWIYDKLDSVPYLRGLGDWGTGKSTWLKLMAHLCYRGVLAGGTSPAVMFRLLDEVGGTFCLDEAAVLNDREKKELESNFLNGYTREFGILRTSKTEAGNYRYEGFDTFGPKVVTSRTSFKEGALENRFVSFPFAPLPPDDPRLDGFPADITAAHRAAAATFRRQLLAWRFEHWPTMTVDPLERIPGLPSRLSQVGRPLLAVTPVAHHPVLLTLLHEQAGEAQAARVDSLEGTVTRACGRLVATDPRLARKCPTGRIAFLVNEDLPTAQHVTHDEIGRALAAIGFRRAPGHNPRGWQIDPVLLAEKLAVYNPPVRQRRAAE
jgi:hypothetical protein